MSNGINKADVLRKFFRLFNNEEIDIIEKVLTCEGKLSKREAYYDNNQSFDNLIEKLKYKRSFGSEKKTCPYPTLFS